MKFKFTKEEKEPEPQKVELENSLPDQIKSSETITITSEDAIKLINELATIKFNRAEKFLIRKNTSKTMQILDDMINSYSNPDIKIKNALKLAKLKIYESNFRQDVK